MVKGIDTTYIGQAVANTQVNKNDVKKLIKYVGGEALTQAPDTFATATKDAVSGTLLFDGIPILNKFIRNKKAKGIGNERLAQLDQRTFDNVKNLFKGEGKLSQRVADFISNNTKIRTEFDAVGTLAKSANKSTKATAKAVKAAEKATKAAQKSAEKIAKAENGGLFSKISAKRALNKTASKTADLQIAAEKAKRARYNYLKTKYRSGATEVGKTSSKLATKFGKLTNMAKHGKFGKVGQAAEKVVSKISGGLGKVGSKLGGFGKVLKSSGAGFMLVFSGIIEGVTEVIPTFKELGVKKGLKQTGKSAIKVAGDTAGFAVGSQIGYAAGAALGAKICGAIGTAVAPGLGTAIGAVVGCIGGFLGSWVMGKVTKAITGKSEREKAKEEQQNIQAEQIANNKQSLEELKALTIQKMEEETATRGKASKDTLEALAALENIEKTNPFQAIA